MCALKICLWIAGIACLLSVVGVVVPFEGLQAWAEFIGDETLPDSPLLVYIVRLMCATYLLVGVYFIILALNPVKYGIMVPFSGLSAILIGLTCAVAGVISAIPIWWFLSDAVSCSLLGFLILMFWKNAKSTPES